MWPYIKLSQIAEFKNGLNFSKDNWGQGLKVIGVADFKDHLYPIYDSLGEINPSGVVREQDYLENGDVLFVRSNGNRELIGRCMLIKDLQEKVSHSGFTIRARLRGEDIHVPFYFYLFRSSIIRSVLSTYGGGVNINNLNQGILSNLMVPKPSLEEQKKIAAILSAYDDLIENNKRRIALLEKMAEEIYREWFVRFRFPGYQQAEFEKGIPKEWKAGPIGKWYKTASGGTPSRKESGNYEGDVNWLKTGELKNTFVLGSEEKITLKGLESSSAKVFPKYTVVIAMYCAMPDITILGEDSSTNQACCAFLPKYDYLSYIYTYYLIKFSQPHMIQYAHGAAQQNLSQDLIKGYKVLVADENSISKFAKLVEPIFMQVKSLMEEQSKLKNIKERLLPRLISGKLSVEELDIQFPPSMQEEVAA